METLIQSKIVEFYFNIGRKNEIALLKMKNLLLDIILSIQTLNPGSQQPYKNILFKLVLFTRDICYGKGERNLSYMMLHTLYKYYSIDTIRILRRFVQSSDKKYLPYGSWSDIKYLCGYVYENGSGSQSDEELIRVSILIMVKQLRKDYIHFQKGNIENLSNCAKWIPREKSQFDWLFDEFVLQWSRLYAPYILSSTEERYGAAFQKCCSQFRRMVSDMSRALGVVETKQCSKKWDEIDFKKIDFGSLLKQQNAFFNIYKDMNTRENGDGTRKDCALNIEKYYGSAENLGDKNQEKGKNHVKNNKKIVSKQYNKIFLSHFVDKADTILQVCSQKSDINNLIMKSETIHKQIVCLNQQWKDYFENLKIKEDYYIPVLDIDSDEWLTGVLNNGIGLSYFISQYSKIGKRVLYNGNWISLDGLSPFAAICEIQKHIHYGASSHKCIGSVLQILIQSILMTNMSSSDIQKINIVVLSTKNRCGEHKQLMDLFYNKGFPHITYWNLSSDFVEYNTPTVFAEKYTLISGFSCSALMYFYHREATMYDKICHILNHPRYRNSFFIDRDY